MTDKTTPHEGERRKGVPLASREQGLYAMLLDDESGERFAVLARVVGYGLLDPLGRKLGEVEKLFVNSRGGPEYVAVRTGALWWKRSFLIPVNSISVDDERGALVLR